MRADDFKEELDDIIEVQGADVSRAVLAINGQTGEPLFVDNVRLGDNGDIEIVINT